MSPVIDTPTLQKLQRHLRRTFDCPTLALDRPAARHATVELRVGRLVVGTVDQVDDEGERSWAVTLVVLEGGSGSVITRP